MGLLTDKIHLCIYDERGLYTENYLRTDFSSKTDGPFGYHSFLQGNGNPKAGTEKSTYGGYGYLL
jgi:hypothetical protein